MRKLMLMLFVTAAFVLPLDFTRTARAEEFPLRDGDTWVMGGDSITAQHLHSNYFEAFCFARYPKLKFCFRNSGVGGDTIPKLLARFEWDVAAWKPTVVSVELGMNDQGGFSVPQYIAGMGQLHERIQAAGARPVYLTSSPINGGDTMAKLTGNTKLNQFAIALQAFAAEKKSPFADQFHAVIDIWGRNKPREVLSNILPPLRMMSQDEKLVGVEHLRAFLVAQEKSGETLVSMQGDPVHPGPPGQLMMAAALLKALGAEGVVSSVSLGANGQPVEARGCMVENVKAAAGGIAFDRTDESLPFPIPDDTRNVLPLFPTILELSQYTLKVGGLTGPQYDLRVNDALLATLSGEQLNQGVNLTQYSAGPIAAQGKEVLAAVNAKEGLVGQWRGLSRLVATSDPTADKAKLAALTQQVEAADAKIRAAAQPRKLHFEIKPAK